MNLALRVAADVFVFVIVAGVGGFFVLLAAARFGMWRERRRDVRTAQRRHPAARALVYDDPCHNPNIHADQGCPVCMVRVVYLKSLVRPLDWDRAYVEEIDR